MVESDRNQMLKAMIPYLPPSGQRFLSMYAKTQELINTMTLFQNRSYYPDIQAASVSVNDPMEMLQDIRKWKPKPQTARSDHQSYGNHTDDEDHE